MHWPMGRTVLMIFIIQRHNAFADLPHAFWVQHAISLHVFALAFSDAFESPRVTRTAESAGLAGDLSHSDSGECWTRW